MSQQPTIILAGAQRFNPTIGPVAAAAGANGPFAVITAGWRAREDDDEELREHLGGDVHNLQLYRRSETALKADPELGEAHRARQSMLRRRQDFYKVRLEHELAAAHVVRQRSGPPELLADEETTSVRALQVLDQWHLRNCAMEHERFNETWKPETRPAIARQRDELADILSRCQTVAISGGHVAALLTRMLLFGLREMLVGKHILAWSAGAMVLTERVVLYHDFPPQGQAASQVLASGLGLVKGIIALPSPETRLDSEDTARTILAARRFAPAQCLGLPAGSTVVMRDGELSEPRGVIKVGLDGTLTTLGSIAT